MTDIFRSGRERSPLPARQVRNIAKPYHHTVPMVAPFYRCERNVELNPFPLSLCLPGVWRYVKLSCLRAVADRQPEVRNGRRSVRFHQNVSRLEIPEEEKFELEQAIGGTWKEYWGRSPRYIVFVTVSYAELGTKSQILLLYTVTLVLESTINDKR